MNNFFSISIYAGTETDFGQQYTPTFYADKKRQELSEISLERFEILRDQLKCCPARSLTIAAIYDDSHTVDCAGHTVRVLEKNLEEMLGSSVKKIKTLGLDFNSKLNQCFYLADSPQPFDLVVYRNNDQITHVGIYRDENLIESKWKGSPYAFLHETFFIPNTYGDQINFYRLRTAVKVTRSRSAN